MKVKSISKKQFGIIGGISGVALLVFFVLTGTTQEPKEKVAQPTQLQSEKETSDMEPASKQEYINKTQNLIKQGSAAMDRVAKAANDYKAKTITESQFEIIVIEASDEIGDIGLSIILITPPVQFKEAHQYLVKGTNLYDSALFELVVFFEERDVKHLDLYVKFMNEGAIEFFSFAEAIE